MSVLCIIPARAGSKGIPNKNIMNLGGLPLVSWTIRQAKTALADDVDNRIVVSTDSEEYKERIDSWFPGEDLVPFLRPAKMATDKSPSSDAVLHAITWFEEKGKTFDIILLLEPTNPLRVPGDIPAALAAFREYTTNRKTVYSLVGIACFPEHAPELAFDGTLVKGYKNLYLLKPYGGRQFSPGHPRRQSLRSPWFMTGLIYIGYTEAYKQNPIFDECPCLGYATERWQGHELDEPDDVLLIQPFLHRVK